MIKFKGQPCLELEYLQQALHLSFNTAQFQEIDETVLNEIDSFPLSEWSNFSEEKFIYTIANCNNSSVPSSDKLLQGHFKCIIKDKTYLKNIVTITNICFELGYWPNHFKKSITIVIPKSNKSSYDSLKSFRPIVLLNDIGKLFEKVTGDRLQFHVVSNNFIHQSQLGGLKFKFTTDTGIVLIHFIHTEWIKNMSTSSLAFNIAQFFPSLNHCLLVLILGKARFDSRVVNFFSNYPVNKKTKYFWNNFSSYLFDINVGVG